MYTIPFLDLPPLRRAAGRVVLPGSKSISNRVLLLAGLSAGHDAGATTCSTRTTPASCSTRCARSAASSRAKARRSRSPASAAASPPHEADLFLGNAGTAMRPLCAALAVLAAQRRRFRAARRAAHARAADRRPGRRAARASAAASTTSASRGYPPLRVHGAARRCTLERPMRVRGDVSSQFLTALLLALPLVARDAPVGDRGRRRTDLQALHRDHAEAARALRHRGAARRLAALHDLPAGSRYRSPGSIHVEGDASSASYFIALGAIAGERRAGAHRRRRRSTRSRATSASSRRRARWARSRRRARTGSRCGAAPGRWRRSTLDCNHIPDAAMTLAVHGALRRRPEHA